MLIVKFLNIYKKIKYRLQDFKNSNQVRAKLGKNVKIMDSTIIDSNCIIGDGVFIGRGCGITKATIGNYTSMGDYISIGPGEHDMSHITTSSFFPNNGYSDLTKKTCIIGNDVWIGNHSIILRGVKIGNGAVIGANSVVTKDVPDYAIVAGSPAKILKYRFNENKIKKILESKWFEKEREEAEKIIHELSITFTKDNI